MASYSPQDKINALAWIDAHPKVPIQEASKVLGIEKNTLYSWTSKAGRKAIQEAIEIVQEEAQRAATREASRRPMQSYDPAPMGRPEPVRSAEVRYESERSTGSARERELEAENKFLKSMVEAYRERFGI